MIKIRSTKQGERHPVAIIISFAAALSRKTVNIYEKNITGREEERQRRHYHVPQGWVA